MRGAGLLMRTDERGEPAGVEPMREAGEVMWSKSAGLAR
jgi:hypothetical protein